MPILSLSPKVIHRQVGYSVDMWIIIFERIFTLFLEEHVPWWFSRHIMVYTHVLGEAWTNQERNGIIVSLFLKDFYILLRKACTI